jgi:hypothetical protein
VSFLRPISFTEKLPCSECNRFVYVHSSGHLAEHSRKIQRLTRDGRTVREHEPCTGGLKHVADPRDVRERMTGRA